MSQFQYSVSILQQSQKKASCQIGRLLNLFSESAELPVYMRVHTQVYNRIHYTLLYLSSYYVHLIIVQVCRLGI